MAKKEEKNKRGQGNYSLRKKKLLKHRCGVEG
jgi:hypothetical protein